MADDFPDFVKFDGFAGQAWYHQMIRDKRILRRAREFTPERLFKSGEQGVWYDPSDLTTLFQDSAGTTPVTASGQQVGRMLDKSGRGNHATQPTAGSRPIYRRGDSMGVVNLLTWSEAFDNAAWTKSVGVTVTPNAVAAPGGSLTADKLVEGTTPSAAQLAIQVGTFPPGSQITASCRVKAAGRGFVRVQIAATNGNTYAATRFNLTTGEKVVTDSDGAFNGSTNVSSSIVTDGDGYYLCSVSCKVPPGIAAARVELRLVPDATTFSYTGDGASGVYVHGAQLNLGPTALPYQRNDSQLGGVATGASTDLHWLETDGVDDGMVTGNINFTGTDKVSVFTGLRKLSDANTGAFCEHGRPGIDVGAWNISAPRSASFQLFSAQFRDATNIPEVRGKLMTSPNTAIVYASMDYAALTLDSQIKMRENAVNQTDKFGTVASGNYGNYPLYLFRRGGTTLPFNGWFYGLAITGRLATDAETVATERYLAAKSAVVIP